MTDSYAREKLDNAVYALATGTGTIQERLLDAFVAMSAVSDRHFEGERLEEWQSIYKRATAVKTGSPSDGYFKTTLFAMSAEDAAQLARDICGLEAMVDLEVS